MTNKKPELNILFLQIRKLDEILENLKQSIY